MWYCHGNRYKTEESRNTSIHKGKLYNQQNKNKENILIEDQEKIWLLNNYFRKEKRVNDKNKKTKMVF